MNTIIKNFQRKVQDNEFEIVIQIINPEEIQNLTEWQITKSNNFVFCTIIQL